MVYYLKRFTQSVIKMTEARITSESEAMEVGLSSDFRFRSDDAKSRASALESSARLLKRMLWSMQDNGFDNAWDAQLRGGEA